MNIYLVVRSGNDEEGPDGEDTSFLIVAPTHIEASNLADTILSEEKTSKVYKFSSHIYQIGIADFQSESSYILLGPIIKYFNIPSSCKNWVRYNFEDEWYKVEESDETD